MRFNNLNYLKIRKKALVLLFIFLAGIVVSSCKTREKCPAYGEYRKFKKEQGYWLIYILDLPV